MSNHWLLTSTVGEMLAALGEYAVMIVSVIWVTLRKPPHWDLIRDQLYEIGVLSLPVVAITGFLQAWC